MKRATLILSILAIVLFIAGTALIVSAASGCTATATGQASCSAGAAGTAGLGGLLNLVGGIATAVAWILGIIKTATLKRWGWFVVVLLLSPLGSLIYGAAGPDQPAV
ncbi:MAG TPA: hypothetical protein VF510_23445 [Ktedonobacterales bacterium]